MKFLFFIPTMGSVRLPLLNFLIKNDIEYVVLSRRNHTAVQRELSLDIFLQMKDYDTLVFLDEDVVPIEIYFSQVEKKFEEGYDVVCGYYFLKTLKGYSVYTKDWLTEIKDTEVNGCALGFTFIKREFLEGLKRPAFLAYKPENTPHWIGEDVYFFVTHKPRTYALSSLKAYHFIDERLALSPEKRLILQNDNVVRLK
ncbi:hypothetical protein STIV2_B197 [Sulfolobus turreted icosahedral virus 2]|uniref:Glycosyltransferase n=1 Tax=Sulfolobus turreted icosahedral virus 2 TaxID=754004 RepID=D5IEY1_9VIRU|nr:hypothetical protein STIV2_B197 [Sulfolobus turreted icosahedral virus 2]ADF27754.1 hypothetical protein STIV2_B197 [Sulfolobus turreted icosahedral virus 2]